MKRIATITFHASYNYGSNLQAYALQEYIKKISNGNCEYKIINLRTDKQKEMYKTFFEKKGVLNQIKSNMFFYYKKTLLRKKELFENFINNKLNITKEYKSLEDLKNEDLKYDYYIAGSDQLWNIRSKDFDWSNFLEFASNGKKISYAASFGPKKLELLPAEKERIKEDLLKFDEISVREQGSFESVKNIVNINSEINIDPTMLLNKLDWEKLDESNSPIYRKGKYIFLYNLKGKEYQKLARKISKELRLPIIISNYRSVKEINFGVKKVYDVGPIEFLNLIRNAEIVLSSSFHGTIFSILLNKPFFALNGKEDLRINTLLKKMGLEERSVNFSDYESKCKNAFNINFELAEQKLNEERKKSEKYLKRVLDIE